MSLQFSLSLYFLFSLFVFTKSLTFLDVVAQEWNEWKVMESRNYTSGYEDKIRFKIFMENKVRISKHNYQTVRGRQSYFLKMNRYGDLLSHEFSALMNGYRQPSQNNTIGNNGATYIPPINVKLPVSIDWRQKGAVTPVKDQGQCGSCWSFSATGALEGQNYRKTRQLISLSEQNLIDCSAKYGNDGCNGGLMDNAFTYIRDNSGIDTEDSYPYEAKDGACRYKPGVKGSSDVGFVDITSGDENALKTAIGTMGPVSVAIDASHESFQFYSHGIYSEKDCSSQELNHALLVVGYGFDKESGMDYWLVKNSWSRKWGLDGYIKIARNKKNMCGIATAASFPLV